MSPDASHDSVVTAAAETVVTAADGLRPRLLRLWGTPADAKDDGTPVTSGDMLADRVLSEAIRTRFPDHGLLSEEAATSAGDSEWTWVIDPIDGTSNYTAGLPLWAVSVALCRDGRPVWALIDAPALDLRYLATASGGATCNGDAIRVRDRVDWRSGAARHLPLLVSSQVGRRARAGVRLNPRLLGSIALELCFVADGRAVAALHHKPHVWDVAAAGLVVTEAGGAVRWTTGHALLPLERGSDYAHRTAPVAAGGDAQDVDRLAEALLGSGD